MDRADTCAEGFLIDASDQARHPCQFNLGEGFPEECMKSATADSWADGETESFCVPLRHAGSLSRKKNEAILLTCCQCNCLGLCTFQEESKRMDEDFLLFLDKIFAHAA